MFLYRIIFKGTLPDCYSIASNPTDAYKQVREFLDEIDYGLSKDKDLHNIEVMAENRFYGSDYPTLYMPPITTKTNDN